MGGNWTLSRRRAALVGRSSIVSRIRAFFQEKGYLEVETPFRIPAPAPEAQIDAIPSDGWYLHTSPELCMKRLLAAGYPKLFQICRCWREGERGTRHLSEFTMLEWYAAGADYLTIMEECESLLIAAAGKSTISYRGEAIDLAPPFERITVEEAFSRYTPSSCHAALENGTFDELMVELIEPRLGQGRPTFIYDYPASRGALARLKEGEPEVAERFELYIAGVELANAFSELTDAQEQRERFEAEAKARGQEGKRVYPLPQKFLEELCHMPDSAGIALGIDRLVMILMDQDTIDDVVAFTQEDL